MWISRQAQRCCGFPEITESAALSLFEPATAALGTALTTRWYIGHGAASSATRAYGKEGGSAANGLGVAAFRALGAVARVGRDDCLEIVAALAAFVVVHRHGNPT